MYTNLCPLSLCTWTLKCPKSSANKHFGKTNTHFCNISQPTNGHCQRVQQAPKQIIGQDILQVPMAIIHCQYTSIVHRPLSYYSLHICPEKNAESQKRSNIALASRSLENINSIWIELGPALDFPTIVWTFIEKLSIHIGLKIILKEVQFTHICWSHYAGDIFYCFIDDRFTFLLLHTRWQHIQ